MDATLFMAYQDMLKFFIVIIQRIVYRHDGTSGVTEYGVYAFCQQRFEHGLRTTQLGGFGIAFQITLCVVFCDFQRVHGFVFLFFCARRSEEHMSELQSLMRISYAVFCLKKKTNHSIMK